MESIYKMSHQPHRLFINFVHACPNACYFCVDFKGSHFYGQDLKTGNNPQLLEIINALENYQNWDNISEIYFCGIGEPLLKYTEVIQVALYLRQRFGNNKILGINTSGTYYHKNKNVDFAKYFDRILISLNAENEEKYNLICRPKNKDTFKVVMNFLYALKDYEIKNNLSSEIQLSVVDCSRNDLLPKEEQDKNIPLPDFEICKSIADSFNWNFKIKPLLEDYHI